MHLLDCANHHTAGGTRTPASGGAGGGAGAGIGAGVCAAGGRAGTTVEYELARRDDPAPRGCRRWSGCGLPGRGVRPDAQNVLRLVVAGVRHWTGRQKIAKFEGGVSRASGWHARGQRRPAAQTRRDRSPRRGRCRRGGGIRARGPRKEHGDPAVQPPGGGGAAALGWCSTVTSWRRVWLDPRAGVLDADREFIRPLSICGRFGGQEDTRPAAG